MIIINNQWKFDLQLHGGGGTTVVNEPAKVPDASPEELRAQKLTNDYNEYIYKQAKPMFDIGTTGFYQGAGMQPNYQGMYNNYQNQMQGIQQGMNGLLNGQLPSQYAANRQAVVQADAEKTLGSLFNKYAQNGTWSSSMGREARRDLSDSVTNTLNKSYNQDMATYSGLLEQGRQTALSPITDSMAAQQAALAVPQNIMALATGQAAPNTQMFNTLYSGRYSLKSDPAAIYQPDGTAGMVGALGSAAITACFAAGTLIDTPSGQKPIEEIQAGDEVLSLDDSGNIITSSVTVVSPARECEIAALYTTKGIVKTTLTQRFLTPVGLAYVEDIGDKAILTKDGAAQVLAVGYWPSELVYDFTVSGRNIFFAGGLAAEGDD